MSEVLHTEPVTERKPYLSISPTSGWAGLRIAEIWEFRDLLVSLASRDVKVRYKQTALGVIWVVLQPLLQAGVLSIVFGKIAGMDRHQYPFPYFLLTYCGQLAWNTFSWTLLRSSECLLNNSQLVSKVFFPRLVLPLSTVASTIVDVAVGMAMLGVLLACYRLMPTAAILLLPLWGAQLVMLGLGLGLIAAAMTVTYRDVKYVVPVAATTMMYACPVMFAAGDAPEKWRWFVTYNPMTPMIEGFRYALLRGAPEPDWNMALIMGGVTVAIFVFSLFIFKRMERRFADVI